MPKKGPPTAAPEINEDDLDVFRRGPGDSTVISSDGYRFRKRKKKSTHPLYKEDWLCSTEGCKAHIFVTGEWEKDADGEYMRGAWVSRTHGRGRPHPPHHAVQVQPAAEAEDGAEDIAANMTALALEETQPAADEPCTSRAAPAEPTMRALRGEADKAAAMALARDTLPDLPGHLREPVIETAMERLSTDFVHGYFAGSELVGLIIGWLNHMKNSLMRDFARLEEKQLAKANKWRTAYIPLLAVANGHRVQGIGKALVNAFIAHAQEVDPPLILYLHVQLQEDAVQRANEERDQILRHRGCRRVPQTLQKRKRKPSTKGRRQNRVITNLLYFQTNYFILLFALFLLLSAFQSQNVLHGLTALVVTAAVFLFSFTFSLSLRISKRNCIKSLKKLSLIDSDIFENTKNDLESAASDVSSRKIHPKRRT
ncbi:PRA1 family protein domain-containing protein [Ditylenchus destructor]|uniref:PRA1 family protein domain-containing protein n=1 Tax=Ditylenchus destructor TaxID=166010 RepID=A0AAD4QWA0_9BILA|nr:PRA1 family protein domain-containing protein [Ditylenchus destructor]